jgi:hypothetical protein
MLGGQSRAWTQTQLLGRDVEEQTKPWSVIPTRRSDSTLPFPYEVGIDPRERFLQQDRQLVKTRGDVVRSPPSLEALGP